MLNRIALNTDKIIEMIKQETKNIVSDQTLIDEIIEKGEEILTIIKTNFLKIF
jgi:hypothetical protein